MTQFNAELYAQRHADDPGLNHIEKIVLGAVIGFGSSALIFAILGLVIHWVVTWP